MDTIVEKARDVWEGQIDYEGQKLAELISNSLLAAVGIIAFIIGYITQNITYTLWTGLGGAALTFLVVVPPWPFYNQHPVQWLTTTTSAPGTGFNIVVDGKKVE